MKAKILFDEKSVHFILEAIGNSITEDGFVIDEKTKLFTLDADGNKFKANELIGIIDKKYITSIFQLM